MKITENASLLPYNTFGIEAKTRFLVEIDSTEVLISFLNQKTDDLPILFLGGGSNILFTQDFEGYTILLKMKGIKEDIQDENTVWVTAMAGENWHDFVLYCIGKNYGGLENLSLIPGNVGTSPIQNIGAYGVEIKDRMHTCTVLDLEDNKVKVFQNQECKFGYRDSIFKQNKGRYCILSVTFALTRRYHDIRTDYGAILLELQKKNIEKPTIQQVSDAVIAIRTSKLPNPKKIGNAGSFFKNPVISHEEFQKIVALYPTIPHYPSPEGVKIPAGWLIENAGWKGKQISNVASHRSQALVIINATGNATGKEIFDFSAQIIASIQQKYGIFLEREVNCL
ncbi:UDP-N-acetylmuramate dehydrogenase [Bergeyella zoohelcum]|uniref:UDP-N-acetylenolpyruvoylglucosamine reductase n=1 Tax=Bergeyella zoohelcum ATCC 43767 TaxID=883096 RepID=K1LQ13_9FLAO|nr:UDP-N-acetylmuramate dehydrogenase [Bergeyella zoohelcum]EKB56841.1 UDP-N-acetylenolpyruvoylglucosamine reductase [Bergeyella zoohelcum ATCC 43767]SUV48576.1 UDP-N-acetylenolpyruvoylglucosamine reductase [Bergeyella zoohelcum]